MKILISGLTREAVYKLMTGVIVPRPIAWVSTRSKDGVVNVAPYSGFTFVSMQPPMVGIFVRRRQGRLKDTAANILETREFVVNIGDDSQIEEIHRSGHDYEPHESEAELLNLKLAPSEIVKPPLLAAAPASLECVFREASRYGQDDADFLVGEVVMIHVRDELYADAKVDSVRLRPACRIGGPNYTTLGEVIRMAHANQIRR